MSTLMPRVDNGLEMKLWAFSISTAQNDLAPELDVSAQLATIFLPVNVVPFPGPEILLATLMHALRVEKPSPWPLLSSIFDNSWAKHLL